MKKTFKIILVVLIFIFVLTMVDIISIYTLDKPIFAIKREGSNGYRGLLYNTYYCQDYAGPQIKLKGVKYSCSTNNFRKVKEIKDTTKDIKDFTCAEMLESFYEDENYIYYYNCIKSKYIIVVYESGFEETVAAALMNGTIKISDLDYYNIDYIKYSKEL